MCTPIASTGIDVKYIEFDEERKGLSVSISVPGFAFGLTGMLRVYQ